MARAPITPLDAEIEAELEKQKENREERDADKNADIADRANRQKERPRRPTDNRDAQPQPS